MTQEQKARAYDEAIKRASKLRVQNPFDTVSQMMEHVFPELKESEDEKIRKEIVDYINRLTVSPNNIDRYNSWIAWLEKQGEKPTLCERYENIAKSDWFKKTYGGLSVSNDEEPKWSDEDKRIRNGLIGLLKFGLEDGSAIAPGCNETKEQALAWLESIKQRMEE